MTQRIKERVIAVMRERAMDDMNQANIVILNAERDNGGTTAAEEAEHLRAEVEYKYAMLAADLLERSRRVFP
jgi:hypothetical protein